MSDEKFQEEHERILREWSDRRGVDTGAFYLLYEMVDGATKVVNEPDFER